MVEYLKKDMTGTYYRLPGFFLFYMPVRVPYAQIVQRAEEEGFKVKDAIDKGIIEKGTSFGKGWIAIEIESTKENHPRVFTLEGEFNAYEHVGSFRELRLVYKQITQDFPNVKEYLGLYYDDPKTTPESEMRTVIVFR